MSMRNVRGLEVCAMPETAQKTIGHVEVRDFVKELQKKEREDAALVGEIDLWPVDERRSAHS